MNAPLLKQGLTSTSAAYDVLVIGLGYVGLPIALMLAHAGLRTAGYDVDAAKMERLRSGACPIEDEPGMADIFHHAVEACDIAFVDEIALADTYLIAVPTPLHAVRKNADLNALADVLRALAPRLRNGNLVIINSTCPVLTCRKVAVPILERSGLKVDVDFQLAYCPERIFPGNIAHELVHNEHTIGGHDRAAAERAAALYRRFVKSEIVLTDDVTAEFCKLIENTYRDVNIALANELRAIARRFGCDIDEAIAIANRHPRVNVHKPGIGVGGHCLPIDPWFIVEMAPAESRIIPEARRLNDEQPHRIAGEIRRAVAHKRDMVIGCFGVTYKPGVKDQRESPAWEIIHMLQEDGYDVRVFDPVAGVGDYTDVAAFAGSVDLFVALVEHAPFHDALAAGVLSGKAVMRF